MQKKLARLMVRERNNCIKIGNGNMFTNLSIDLSPPSIITEIIIGNLA
jgi:hypothetical protein